MKLAMIAPSALLAMVTCNGAAHAAVLPFTGNLTALSFGVPDPSCSPLLFRSTVSAGNGSGTSSLGNFGYTASVCQSPGLPVNGTFAINFATDGLQGTISGSATPTGTPGIFSPNFTYAILTGTGRFLNATGTFLATGSIDARTPPSQLSFQLNGSVNAPAVPEPATWGMMLLGLGGIGMAMRRRRSEPAMIQIA